MVLAKLKSNITIVLISLFASMLFLYSCSEEYKMDANSEKSEKSENSEVTVKDAEKFLAEVEATYQEVSEEAGRIFWIQNTYINYDSNWLATRIGAKINKLAVDYANESKKYNGLKLPADMQRKMDGIRLGITLPAPSKVAGAADELAEISTKLDELYSTGTIEYEGEVVPQNQTEVLMRQVRDPAKLEEIWTKWRENSKPMKDKYARMVDIANQGAKELGFKDVGVMWRSGYDMDPDEFATEVDRLWGQVEPLYKQLHCHVRAKLNDKYGSDVVPLDKPIRADLLANMWAQQWGSLYDLVAPADTGGNDVDIEKLLVAKGYDAVKMVKTGENFFSSLGFAPLPETFWERSQITKPRDRNVVCHASAWNIDNMDDIRIKMCTNVDAEDFRTVHHELGHNYYQRAYNKQPTLFQGGANDGFHEAIGDMVALSITPEYLQQIGLLDQVPDASGDVGLLMQQALEKIAFLPFGLLVDKWRWQVFSGELTPDTYNDGWWALREKYQGIRPVGERDADAFDPGAKYHIPGNTPYMRYFLAHILQFQFYKAACDMVGWDGPIHRCSFYNNKEVGEKLNAMLEMGASKPWPEALEAFTGTTEMDATAIIDYFAPLMEYLEEENEDRTCGW